MADRPGHSGPTPPRYRVDGQLTDQKPPKADRRPIAGVERPPEGGRPVVIYGAAQERPAFPLRPLDLDCVKPATLSAEGRAEVIQLVRLVQTDFDPERDPRGWESVADIVRGAGRTPDEVRQMDYRELAAFFRVNHEAQKIRLGGAIETTTPSIVSYNAAQAGGQGVLRVGTRGRDTRKIDVDSALGKLEAKLRKELVRELGSESAADAALVDRLYSLSAESLAPMLKSVGCKTSAKTIYRPGNSRKYESWARYRHPSAGPVADVDLGPAYSSSEAGGEGLADGCKGDGFDDSPDPTIHLESGHRPSATDAANDAMNSGHISKRTGGRGITRIGKTAAEKAADDAADRFAREAGIDLPPAE